MMRLSITTTTTHPRDTCSVCERMAREAEGTALRHGSDSWVSEDVHDGIRHVALYEFQSGEK